MSSWRNSSYGDDDSTRVNLPPIERLDSVKFNRSHHDVPLPPIDCDPFSTREIGELPSLPPLSDYLARRSDFSEQYSACPVKSKLQLPKWTSFYERSGSSDSDDEHFRHPLDLNSNLRLPPIMSDLKFEQPDPLHVLCDSIPLATQINPKRGEYCDTYRPDMYSTRLYHKKNMAEYQDELQGMEKLAQKLADQRLSSTKVDSFHLLSNESIESGMCISQDTWGSHRKINGLSESTCIEEVLSRKRSWDQEYRQTELAGASDQWSRDRRHSIATMSSPSSPIPNSSLPKKPHMISTREIKMHTEISLSLNIQPLTLVSPDSTHFPDTLSHIQALLPASESKQNNTGPCSGVKNHACNVTGCNMRFKRLEHLKRHLRVHTMERPYACTYTGCRKTFSRRDNLGQHLRTHQRQEAKTHSRQDSM